MTPFPSRSRGQRPTWGEVNARLWAAIHLVQSVRLGREDDGLADALLEARCFDKADDAQVQDGLH